MTNDHQSTMPAKEAIQRAIELIPGLTKSQLCNHLNMPWGTLWYQVSKLVDDGVVQVLTENGRRHLFPSKFPNRLCKRVLATRCAVKSKILNLIKEHRQVTIPIVMEYVNIGRRAAKTNLESLSSAGLLERVGSGRLRYTRPRENTDSI